MTAASHVSIAPQADVDLGTSSTSTSTGSGGAQSMATDPLPPPIPVAPGFPGHKQAPSTRNKAMETVTIPLGPGAGQALPLAGNRFFVVSSTGPVNIRAQNAPYVTYYGGEGLRGKQSDFSTLWVQNPSATGSVTFTMAIGFDDFLSGAIPALPGAVVEAVTILTANTTPQPLSTVDVWFVSAFFYGYKALAGATPTNNGANVSIGKSATYQPDIIAPGQVDYPITPPPGRAMNLAQLYFQGAAGDGLFWSVLQ